MRARCWRLLSLLLACSTLPATSWALSELGVEGSLVVIGTGEDAGAPSPIVPAIGSTIPFYEQGILTISAGILIFANNYELVAARPVPTEVENRDFLVVTTLIDATRRRCHVAGRGDRLELLCRLGA